jgi:leucyl aminopeptidase
MTTPTPITFTAFAHEDFAVTSGKIAIFVTEDGKMDQGGRKINSLTRKTVARVAESDAFEKA